MKTKNDIVQILLKGFYSLLCDTCENDSDGDKPCFPCYHHPEKWTAAITICDEIADRILR